MSIRTPRPASVTGKYLIGVFIIIEFSWIVGAGFPLWSTGTLGVIYLLIMLYIFLGVAIISDKFMDSIEEITA